MARSHLDVSRWLLGLEALVCLGPLTLLWMSATYLVLTGENSTASVAIPALIGTLGPVGLLLMLCVAVLRRSVSSAAFAILATSFAAIAVLQILKPGIAWFAFDWRVWMLNSVLPCVACAHFALMNMQEDHRYGVTA